MTDRHWNYKVCFWLIINIVIVGLFQIFTGFLFTIAVGFLIYLQFSSSLDGWSEENYDYHEQIRTLRVADRADYIKEIRQRSWFA